MFQPIQVFSTAFLLLCLFMHPKEIGIENTKKQLSMLSPVAHDLF